MKKDSIFFTITLTFILSFIMIVISFLILYEGSKKREEHFILNKNMDVGRMFMKSYKHEGFTKELEENLHSMNFSFVDDGEEIKKILSNKRLKKIIYREGRKFENLELDGKYYIYIDTSRGEIMLVNNSEYAEHSNTIVVIFSILFLSFLFLYITTLQKLKPLKVLQKQVEGFGDEEFDIESSTSKQDEISLLANEFYNSSQKLKKLKESRNIFIRNIMHELKTPITKGKFLTQLPQTDENSEKMQKVFYRLEALINEFASIEELLSSKNKLLTKNYYLEDIIDNAVDILMCDENQVSVECENIKVNVNFKLFSIALKNLLDNGIKYSTDKHIKIKTEDERIIFESLGAPLQYPLKNYYEPFFKGSAIKSNQSFGLGLYIVKHIVDANGYKLEYLYENSTNKFILYL